MKYYCFKFRKFNLQLLIYKCRKYVHIFFPVVIETCDNHYYPK